jgi:hypothetical protein
MVLHPPCADGGDSLPQGVIIVTGDLGGATSAAFLQQCGQPWVPKPCTAAESLRGMQQVLRRSLWVSR